MHRFWITVLCLVALSIEARAQGDWPNRPIKIIVSQAAGAAPDIVCRYLADWLSSGLGQQLVIDMGVTTDGAGSIAETGKFIRDEYALWQQALRDIGLEPQ